MKFKDDGTEFSFRRNDHRHEEVPTKPCHTRVLSFRESVFDDTRRRDATPLSWMFCNVLALRHTKGWFILSFGTIGLRVTTEKNLLRALRVRVFHSNYVFVLSSVGDLEV